MNKEQLQTMRRLVFELYGKAAELMGIFSKEDIELEELKKIHTGKSVCSTFPG